METLSLIRALPTSLGRREHREACLRLGREYKGVQRFEPFTTDELLRLSEWYREDLNQLQREIPGVLLERRA